MELSTEQISIINHKVLNTIAKTPDYQRRAYLTYLVRNKDNEEFKIRRRKQQIEYYKRKQLKKLILKQNQTEVALSSI
jgi:aromatic ring hydroxylase